MTGAVLKRKKNTSDKGFTRYALRVAPISPKAARTVRSRTECRDDGSLMSRSRTRIVALPRACPPRCDVTRDPHLSLIRRADHAGHGFRQVCSRQQDHAVGHESEAPKW